MVGTNDLTNSYEVERLRRSVAMLPAGTSDCILTREEALQLLDALRRTHSARPLE